MNNDSLFHQLIKDELTVLIKGLESLKEDGLTDGEKEYKEMCLGTLKGELQDRYTRWNK